MKEFVATIMDGDRLTIPAEVREQLGLGQGDQVAFIISDDGDVALRILGRSSIAPLRGAAGTLPRPISWEEIERTVEEERAMVHYEKLQRQARD